MNLLRVVFGITFWIWYGVVAVVLFFVNLGLWMLTAWWDRRRVVLNFTTSIWAACYVRFSPGWKVTVRNREKLLRNQPVLFISNHLSAFDIYLLYQLFVPLVFVSKRSNFKVPFIGWNMAMLKLIGFVREDRKEILRMVKQACQELSYRSLLIFPEGTRSRAGRLQPFKGGAFTIARKAGVPIQPLVITGTYDLLPPGTFFPNLSGELVLTILDPISPEQISQWSTDELKDHCYQLYLDHLPERHRPAN